MPISHYARAFLIAAAFAPPVAGSTAVAAPSTARGQISVAQVMEMLSKAPAETPARHTLIAYLAGVGEAAGTLIDAAVAGEGPRLAACKGKLNLDDASVRRALERSAPNRERWVETAATPVIVRDMLERAGCKAAR